MLTHNTIRQLRDAYCDSPGALHLCGFSHEFATAWQDPTQRDALCELARRFLRATNRESEWATAFPSTRYNSLFLPENVFVTCAESNTARHNIRVDFLNWLLEQSDNNATTTTRGARTYILTGSRVGKSDRPPLPPTE